MASPESHRVAVVGCGQWGQNLVRDFVNLQALVAVVDEIPSRAEETALRVREKGYAVKATDWASVVSDTSITAVALATPAPQHADMAIVALGAGKHVFIEKPLALTVADGEHIRSAALQAGRVAMVGHCFQYHPAFLLLKALVDEGKLGQILHIHSRRLGFGRIRHEEDVFWNLAPHDISMILALVGQEPKRVQARGERHLRSHIADVASADLTFDNGVHAQIQVSWIYPEKERKMILVGERAMAVFDDCAPWERKLRVFHHRVNWTNGIPEPAKGEVEVVALEAGDPLADECRHFLECIRTGKEPLTNIDEGLAVVRVLCAVEEAMRQSRLTYPTLLDCRPPASFTPNCPNSDRNEKGEYRTAQGEPPKPNDSHDLLTINGNPELTAPPARTTIPLVDLAAQRERIQKRLSLSLAKVIDHSAFILGPEVRELESRLCAFSGATHAITCASGTDALMLALLALGMRRGDAVLVPALTFIATVEPVVLLGAVPVIVDVEPDTLTIDPALIGAGVDAAREAGLRLVGLIAVDLFGHPADYEALRAVATRHGLWILADAAQSFGASVSSRRVGTLADVTTTSFFPSKPLGCYGDGGAVLTDDAVIAATVRSLRQHGQGKDKFDSVRVGLNSRLDTLQAAVLLCKLDILAEEMASRQQVASRYTAFLHCVNKVRLPVLRKGVVSAWASYTLRITERSAVQARLRAQGIASAVYYPRPVHKQVAYQRFPVANGSCIVAERACSEVLSLPMHPYLEVELQEKIATAVK